MTKIKSMPGRQGDVLVIEIERLPDEATVEVAEDPRGIVLAEGEATGHAHCFPVQRSAKLFRTEEDRFFLKIGGGGAVLKHEEHAPIEFRTGNFEVRRQHEHQPGEVPRNVAD